MKLLTIESIKATLTKLGYKWFADRPNIIGIRSNLNVPDIFNDLLCVVHTVNGKEAFHVYQITTDPGVHYQKNLLNTKGCAIIKPGQYVEAYSIGLHQNNATHKALLQLGKITVYRDSDKDGIAHANGVEDTGYFGCNIHGAKNMTTTAQVGPWSAGCQVFQTWSDKEEFIGICEAYKSITGNKFTYTLINEDDLT